MSIFKSIKRFFSELAGTELGPTGKEFDPKGKNWAVIRDFILDSDIDGLDEWVKHLAAEDIYIPKPLLDFAKRKIRNPRSFEFYTSQGAREQMGDFKTVNMAMTDREILDINSPQRYKGETPFLRKMHTYDDWQAIIEAKADYEFQGINLSRIGMDMYEWQKDRLYKKLKKD